MDGAIENAGARAPAGQGHCAKIYGAIIDSSVWQEGQATRLVWITLVAIAQTDGVVVSSLPGLAHRARVTLDECAAGLERLMQPDPYNEDQSAEGRRIAIAPQGWRVLDITRHREFRTPKQIAHVRYQQAFRERKKQKERGN